MDFSTWNVNLIPQIPKNKTLPTCYTVRTFWTDTINPDSWNLNLHFFGLISSWGNKIFEISGFIYLFKLIFNRSLVNQAIFLKHFTGQFTALSTNLRIITSYFRLCWYYSLQCFFSLLAHPRCHLQIFVAALCSAVPIVLINAHCLTD